MHEAFVRIFIIDTCTRCCTIKIARNIGSIDEFWVLNAGLGDIVIGKVWKVWVIRNISEDF